MCLPRKKKKAEKKQIDDLLLELVDRGGQEASRRGIYVTFTALALLLAFFAAVADFIGIEGRRHESETVASIGNTVAYNAERRLNGIATEVAALIEEEPLSCRSGAYAFLLFEELLEISQVDAEGRVTSSCPNPSVMGSVTRHPGRTLRPDSTVSALGYARTTRTALYSQPYERGYTTGGPFADLIVPSPGGRADLVARISLETLLRLSDEQRGTDIRHIQLAVDGKPYPAAGQEEPRFSIVAGKPLPPLPAGVGILVKSTRFGFLHDQLPFVWGILALALLAIIAVASLLRLQYLQIASELTLKSRNLVQQAMSRSFIDGLTVRDRRGKILFVNETLEKLFGFPSPELLGRMPPFPFRHPDNDAETHARLDRITDAAAADSAGVIFRARRADGSELLCLTETRPLIDSGGERIGWLSTFRDVTEDYRARTELTRVHLRISRVLDFMDAFVSVVSLDEGRQMLFANTGYIDAFGSSAAAHIRLIAKNSEADADRGSKGEIFDGETGRWLLVRSKKISWVDGSEVEMMTANDITGKHLGEEALENQRKAAENSSRLITIGETASSLAHELNQPLAAVQNYASAALTLLESGRLTEKNAAEAFNKIVSQTQRAAGIMRRIRNIARRGDPVFAPAEVRHIIDETMELAQILARQMGMHVAVNLEPGLPQVECDAIMTEQMLLNLIKNAMEASTESAERTVTVSAESRGDRVLVSVADRGCGISAEVRSKLFEPFFTTKQGGTGIGLNICRSIAEIHRGRLAIEDNPGGGAVFRFTLPAIESNENQQ